MIFFFPFFLGGFSRFCFGDFDVCFLVLLSFWLPMKSRGGKEREMMFGIRGSSLFSWDGNWGNSWIWKFDFFFFLFMSFFFCNEREFDGEYKNRFDFRGN